MRRQTTNISFLLFAFLTLLFYSCSPTRKLKEGQFLLNEVRISDHASNVDKSDVQPYVKQKPNKKILGLIRFHLWLYNLANEDRVKRKTEAWAEERDKENTKLLAEGKKAKTNNKFFLGEWLMDVGEAPVIYDSILTHNSSKQISLFLKSKGYFYNTVRDSVSIKRKRAKVTYIVQAKSPYTIRKINYEVDDENINRYVLQDSANCLLKAGHNYDVDIMQKELRRQC